jgi:uncharacterized damage-inducible protein DinB
MADPHSRSELVLLTAEEFSRYFEHMAGRVESAVRAVAGDALWVKPFPFGNSIGHLVLHLTGNLNHYIGALIEGSGYIRDRQQEFTQNYHPPVEELMKKFHEAIAMVLRTLHAQDDASLQAEVEENVPIKTRLGLFLVCASHMNNHIGQMSYLLAALKPGMEQKPVW